QAWSYAVETGHPLGKLWREERSRSRLRFPNVEVERFPLLRVDREGFGAQTRKAHKSAPRRLGDLPHMRFAELIPVTEPHQHSDHVALLGRTRPQPADTRAGMRDTRQGTRNAPVTTTHQGRARTQPVQWSTAP